MGSSPLVDRKGAPELRRGPPCPFLGKASGAQTVKELPHPHPPVALGFLKVNPEPIMVLT